ncbi:hypothetical protein MCBMB27_00799 [Methylobacterium phyllosphaerae]|uniref:Uncharacterized protein n=1 Tax=Methylobacterium phyllosphaerae TaxID=418223 RepID=A0AAE8HYJ8_9HYPH|nr:DUF6492 family protein [Methylobacterium phyllosphaerae]APT30090.1 hypothetical protein MCBMB27_00799 [Methylobacterium phyllosphaerae]SFH79416.1 hypothetical protein SAMN05192567_1672 [Methylobacterium phyllosphaerae]
MTETCSTSTRYKMDVAVVTCRKDLHLLAVMLKSFSVFSKIDGILLIFCDDADFESIKHMDLPPGSRLISKQSIVGDQEDDFRVQMYIKLQLCYHSDADYIWSIDSDYLLIADLHSEDFFQGGRPIWQYRCWDNEPSLRWRSGTGQFLGFDPSFQFMDRPIYVLDRAVLEHLNAEHDLWKILTAEVPPSEYMIYGAFAHRFHQDAHCWWKPADDESSVVYSVNQRPPSYCIVDPDIELRDAGCSKYCVFWSHWDLAESKMLDFYSKALRRSGESAPANIDFYPCITLAELTECGFLSIGYQYPDNWLHPSVKFRLLEAERGYLCLSIYAADLSKVSRCVVSVGASVDSHLIQKGANLIRIPLNEIGPSRVQLVFEGCRYVTDGSFDYWRQVSVQWAGAYVSSS